MRWIVSSLAGGPESRTATSTSSDAPSIVDTTITPPSVSPCAVASAAFAGCDSEDTKRYDVTVTWNVAGAEVCSAYLNEDTTLEFDNVEINVYKTPEDTEPIQDAAQASCSEFSYTIPRLKRGTYHVELGAYAEDDDGDYLPYYQAEGEIEAPSKEEDGYQFGLALGKGSINVRWGFEDYGWCDSNGVTNMDISLADEVTVSAHASRMGGSQVYLKHNETFPVVELLKALMVRLGSIDLDVFTLRNDIEEASSFSVVAGECEPVIEMLAELAYDGGTSLNALEH